MLHSHKYNLVSTAVTIMFFNIISLTCQCCVQYVYQRNRAVLPAGAVHTSTRLAEWTQRQPTLYNIIIATSLYLKTEGLTHAADYDDPGLLFFTISCLPSPSSSIVILPNYNLVSFHTTHKFCN